MRKLLLSIFALTALTFSLKAQTTGGPDTYGYIWRNNLDLNGPAYNWIDIKNQPGTIVIAGLDDDNQVGPINLPTPFHYYWYDVSKFWVGSNGYVVFIGGGLQASGNNGFATIPTPGPASTQDNFIAGFMSDLIFGTNGGNQGSCYYNISPTQVVITYDSVPFWMAPSTFTGYNTFQIVLDYSDSSILVTYKDQMGTSAAPVGFVSAGIENNSGSIGLQYLFDSYPAGGSAVKYYPPASTTLAINDAATTYNDNPENGGFFLSKNGGAYTLVTEVANVGNQNLAAFPVVSLIRTALNATLVTNNASTSPLIPGQSQFITHTNTFTPTNTGAFYFRTDTQLPGDATPSNNRKDVEIEVVDTTLANIELGYELATASTLTNSWTGGGGGSAIYIKPPFAPYTLNAVKEFITADPNLVGYSMMVYDDNGPGGAPGTLLDSVFVASATLNTWTTTALANPILKTSGGFYILWFMGGDGVGIGTVATLPISNRTFEVLGGSNGSNFATYRDRATTEFMLRGVISKVVSVGEVEKGELFGNIYPNPASSNKVFMSYDLSTSKSSEFTVKIYNTKGQIVQSNIYSSTKGTLELDVQNFVSGLYLCKIENGSAKIERRFTIVK